MHQLVGTGGDERRTQIVIELRFATSVRPESRRVATCQCIDAYMGSERGKGVPFLDRSTAVCMRCLDQLWTTHHRAQAIEPFLSLLAITHLPFLTH